MGRRQEAAGSEDLRTAESENARVKDELGGGSVTGGPMSIQSTPFLMKIDR
jgi:hypothetical protein